jgi:LmbE family N-acetylglucosaminyl deacetylase
MSGHLSGGEVQNSLPVPRKRADPAELFQGVVAVIAPHMDDEVLACGGTIARIPQKERIHLIYATDGSQSPVPAVRWSGSASPDLSAIRMSEARAALDVLGVPIDNIHFLNFPDAKLRYHLEGFGEALQELLQVIKPQSLLVPFRYDRHPDHLAVNRVTTSVLQRGDQVELFEYFVYTHWRLLPKRDIRRYIRPEQLIEIDIEAESARKRQALACFKSQTTRFYPWQHRPNLTDVLLDEVCRVPEVFLRYNPSFPDTTIFVRGDTCIRMAHVLEPALKREKDRIFALLHSLNHKKHEDELL